MNAPKNYGPLFLNNIIERAQLKNDAALAHLVQTAPPVVSKIRTGRISIGEGFILKCHLMTGISIRQLKEWAHKRCLLSLVQK